MRSAATLLAILLTALPALAQTVPPPPDKREALDPRKNQKVERLRTEDNANRIDEVRVGGQSQSVTVQPKGDMPSYELAPTDLARSRPADSREGLAGRKQRVWNILSF
jgi:hypothetical protein